MESIQIPDADKLYSCNVIVIPEDITQKTITPIVKEALALHMVKDKSPVSVIINSCGGNVSAGWQLVDILLGMKRVVTTYILGDALSMGAMIALAGDVRIATPRSCIMLHQYSWGYYDKYHELKSIRGAEDHMHKVFMKYIEERASREAAELYANKSDQWLTPMQARKVGIIHKIVNRVNIPRSIGKALTETNGK